MAEFTIVLGNKNYSSWSMRGWLAMCATGAPFEEKVIPLGEEGSQARKNELCPAGKVPTLIHGDRTIWDSLAIAEYLAERFPDAQLWPRDQEERAVARSVCAEMHSGFQDLRSQLPMNCRASIPGLRRSAGVMADIERILAIWLDCRTRFGGHGPFLFGRYSLADAFYAPVVSRFQTYAVELDDNGRAYSAAVLRHPEVAAWIEAARDEPWTIEKNERGRPRR
jgi:glutathione S-transferase